MLQFSVRTLFLWSAIFAVGLSAGLYWSRGPAWVLYYHQGFSDGFKSGEAPLHSELHRARLIQEWTAAGQGSLHTAERRRP